MGRRVAVRILLDTRAFVCIGLVDFGRQALIGYRWRRGRAMGAQRRDPQLRAADPTGCPQGAASGYQR